MNEKIYVYTLFYSYKGVKYNLVINTKSIASGFSRFIQILDQSKNPTMKITKRVHQAVLRAFIQSCSGPPAYSGESICIDFAKVGMSINDCAMFCKLHLTIGEIWP